MKRKACLVLCATSVAFIAFLWGMSGATVKAQETYPCDFDLSATVTADHKVYVSEQLNFVNSGSKTALPALVLTLPYNISEVSIHYGHRTAEIRTPLEYKYKDKVLQIELGEKFLKSNERGSITLNYLAEGIAAEQPAGQKIAFLPAQKYCEPKTSTVSLNFPVTWGQPDYLSGGDELTAPGKIITEGGRDIYAAWGNWSNTSLNVTWKLDYGTVVPLPGSLFNEFVFAELPPVANVYKDDLGNEFLDLEGSGIYTSQYSGSLSSRKHPLPLPELREKYSEGDAVAVLGIDPALTRLVKYRLLLDNFKPALTRNANPLMDLKILTSQTEQDSLDYALAWAALLEQEGQKPYILYGPVALPLNHDVIWGYWVGLSENGEWTLYDPFLEDMMGIDGYGKISPQHYPWGIITNKELFLSSSLGNITNTPEMIVSFNQQQLILGDSFQVEAQLNIKDQLSRNVGLNILNNGNNIVFLQDLKVLSTLFPANSMRQLGILPKQSKYIDLTPYVSWKDLLTNQGILQGELELSSNGKLYTINSRPATISTYWIFPVAFLVLFIAFIILINLSRSGVFNLIRSGNFNLIINQFRLFMLRLKTRTAFTDVPAPPLEPGDLPDIASDSVLNYKYEHSGFRVDHGFSRDKGF